MHSYKTHVTTNEKGRVRRPAGEMLATLILARYTGCPGPIVIAIGGPGGTGKSTLCQELHRQLPDSAVLTLDDYKTPRAERHGKNLFGAHPDANDMDLVRSHLQAIRDGQPFERPVYDSVTGEARETVPFSPARFNLVDGEISTYRDFRELVDFSVFLDSDWKTQLTTRITRDVEVRKYTEEKAIATFLQSNLREFAEHGAESKRWADVHLYVKSDYSVLVESVSTELFSEFGEVFASEFLPVDLSGLIVAVATPFKPTMEIDRRALIEHLEFLAEHGVERVLMNGTTGEFFSLTPDERKSLLSVARRYFPGVVLFQAGCDSLAQTTIEAHWAEEYGADAVVALPPYYFAEVGDAGLVDYFNHLGAELEVPLILYNFPKHTQNPITPEVLRQVEHFGLKDSSKDLGLIPHTPNYFIGGDRLIAEAASKGAVGFVTGQGNHSPAVYVAMEAALKSGDATAIANAQCDVDALLDSPMGIGGIVAIKRGISAVLPGYPATVRTPLR